jgi:2,4-dienoyl-CoA reductase-like NADH-dependent reductase (Old Yellow Enzyme family)/thioredoxin reductase
MGLPASQDTTSRDGGQKGAPVTTSVWSPVTVGALTLRHRLIMAAMGTGFPTPGGDVSDRLLRYLARQAQGGIALVTTEAAAVDASGAPFPGVLRADDDARLAGLGRLADAVHAHGVPVSLQIYHAGRQMSRRVSGREPVAPSPIPCPLVRELPRALDRDEIPGLVEAFARAAGRARAAGFDAVELHGAHGYLLHQFLTPLANQRSDDYGGDLRGRARFALEVVRRVRERVGKGFPILFKLSAEDRLPGGLTIEDTLTVGRWLEEAGVDALIVSAGTYGSFEWVVQPFTLPRACLRGSAARFRRAVSVPIVAVGRIADPTLADEIVRGGEADLVAMGRALLADSDLPRKAQAGRSDDIRPCITCNDCLGQIMKAQPIRCAVNPEIGRESEFPPQPSVEPRRIAVGGGGPAGMQAALIARERGHEVTLLEAQAELGGRLRLAARLESMKGAGMLVAYLARRLAEAGVAVRLNARATPEDIRRLAPDAVIVATGGRVTLPRIPGIEEPYVRTAEQCLAAASPGGGGAAVIGGASLACQAAWYLRERGWDVTILAPGRDLARDLESVTRGSLIAALQRLDVHVRFEVRVEEIRDRQVHFTDGEGHRAAVAATLVVGAHEVVPEDGPRRELEADGWTVHAIGDCAGPGDIAGAIHRATDVALRI